MILIKKNRYLITNWDKYYEGGNIVLTENTNIINMKADLD